MATYEEIAMKRWRARTDLIWLCNSLLGMKHVSADLNGTMVNRLQQFHKPKSLQEALDHDKWDAKLGWQYRPLHIDETRLPALLPDPMKMPGKRKSMHLDSRGYLKTSVVDEAHSIQWIINYPDIAILLFQGSGDLASKNLCQIKEHFISNIDFRDLFPDLCPVDPKDFGTMDEFTIPGRSKGYIREQPTVKSMSLEKAGAGQHVEVIKYSDVVNEENSDTKDRCAKISDKFHTSQNLLMSSAIYWIDVDGTRYNLNDCYGEIIDEEMAEQRVEHAYQVGDKVYLKRGDAEKVAKAMVPQGTVIQKDDYYFPQPDKREWNIYINCCYKVAHSNPTFDYDDMLSPTLKFQMGEDGLPVSRFPSRFPSAKLEKERKKKPFIFACQKLNNPVGDKNEVVFPVGEGYPVLIPRQKFKDNVRLSHYEIAVDTARTQSKRADYTALVVGAFDSGGRCYITEMIHGRFHEERTADYIFELSDKYKPQRVLMEKDPGNSGIRVWLQRRMAIKDTYIPIVDVHRAASVSGKADRIASTLRAWYMSGDLRFLDDLGTPYEHLLKELRSFTQGGSKWFDDILDAIATLFFDKRYLGRLSDRPEPGSEAFKHNDGSLTHKEEIRRNALERYVGIAANNDSNENSPNPYYQITGGF